MQSKAKQRSFDEGAARSLYAQDVQNVLPTFKAPVLRTEYFNVLNAFLCHHNYREVINFKKCSMA